MLAVSGGGQSALGLPPIFGEASRPDVIRLDDGAINDTVRAVNINGHWALINQNIRLVTTPEFDWTDDGFDGLARATLGRKTGFLRGDGEWRFVPEFDEVDRFAEGLAVFRGPEGGYGYLDQSKKIRHAPDFTAALRFKDGYAAVRVGDRIGFLDLRMKLAIALDFTAARSFHEGLAAVRLGGPHPAEGRWAYINVSGRQVFVDPTGDIEALGDFNDSLARFRIDGRWGYLDRNYRHAAEPRFEDARDFTNGMAAVKLDGKWGYLDRRLKLVIPFTFEHADDFDENLAMVRVDGKVGFIDRTGRMRIQPEFDWAEPFRNGVARVSRGDSFAYVGPSGYVFFDPQDARHGIVDIRTRERLRILGDANSRIPYNRIFEAPPARPRAEPPYPPEYLYDEGLDISVPWQLRTKTP